MDEEEFSEKEEEPKDIYTEEGIEEELEEDEISEKEAGLMEGYEEIKDIKCNNCGKLIDVENFVEREIKGKLYLFCSEKCAEKFEQKMKKRK